MISSGSLLSTYAVIYWVNILLWPAQPSPLSELDSNRTAINSKYELVHVINSSQLELWPYFLWSTQTNWICDISICVFQNGSTANQFWFIIVRKKVLHLKFQTYMSKSTDCIFCKKGIPRNKSTMNANVLIRYFLLSDNYKTEVPCGIVQYFGERGGIVPSCLWQRSLSYRTRLPGKYNQLYVCVRR